jgi:hypothetical protein
VNTRKELQILGIMRAVSPAPFDGTVHEALALAVDGVVKIAGKVPSLAETKPLLA